VPKALVDLTHRALQLCLASYRGYVGGTRDKGITVPPARGFPFQAVADGKRGKKWAKWLTQIDLSTDMVFNG
jgi:hypothetical protein